LFEKRIIASVAVLGAICFLLAIYPLFFRMDFAAATTFDVTDFLRLISPAAIVYLLILCALLGLYIGTLSSKNTTFLLSLVIVLVFFALFTVSQYPALSDRDYFLHGRLAVEIINSGHFPLASIPGNYYIEWPGAFTMRAIFSLVLGLPEIESVRVLSFVFQILIVLFFYVFAKTKLGSFLAGLVPAVFLLSNLVYTTSQIDHFCPQLFSLSLFLLILYCCTRSVSKDKAIKMQVVIILLSFIIFISHPITPVFLLPVLVGICLLNAYMSRRGEKTFSLINFRLVFLLSILFLAWSIFSAGVEFSQGISQIALIENPRTVAELQPLHYEGILLNGLSYYWKILDLIIALAALYLFIRFFRRGVKERENLVVLSGILLGVASGSLLFSFTGIFTLTRTIMFVLIPASFLAVIFAKRYVGQKVLAFALILLFIPSFLSIYSFSSENQTFQHTWEISACQWLSKENMNRKLVSSDYDIMMIYSYYDPNSWPSGIVGDEEITKYTIPVASNPFFKGDFMIRSVRQDLFKTNMFREGNDQGIEYWNQLDSYANNYSELDKIFDNNYAKIYARNG
jgi:hypothetical protein